jgi:hypothetical protein
LGLDGGRRGVALLRDCLEQEFGQVQVVEGRQGSPERVRAALALCRHGVLRALAGVLLFPPTYLKPIANHDAKYVHTAYVAEAIAATDTIHLAKPMKTSSSFLQFALFATIGLAACADKGTDSGAPSDGGTADGGTSDGGSDDGGSDDGGSDDGGSDDGGSDDGGSDDGGSDDGGSDDGGGDDGGSDDGGGDDGGSGDGGSEVTDTTLVDFESSPTLTGFGGAETATVTADPTDATNNVATIVKSASAETWGGVTVSYCDNNGIVPLPFTKTEQQMTVRFWSPDAGTVVLLKVEDTSNSGISVETEATTTAKGSWETLTFDFSMPASGTAALDLSNTYDKVSIFPNFGTSGGTAGEKTYYVDDITFLGAVFAIDCDTGASSGGGVPITFDDSATTYTLTGFGGLDENSVLADPVDGSSNVAKAVKADYAETWGGTTVSTGSDYSIDTLLITDADTRMQMRVWSPRAGIVVRLKIEDASDPTHSVETDATVTTAEAWETLTFDFLDEGDGTAALDTSYTFNKLSVFFDYGTSGADGGGGTFYYDDIDMAP